jgi:hypothetical protein
MLAETAFRAICLSLVALVWAACESSQSLNLTPTATLVESATPTLIETPTPSATTGTPVPGVDGGFKPYPTPAIRAPAYPQATLPPDLDERRYIDAMIRGIPAFEGTISGFRFFPTGAYVRPGPCEESSATFESVAPEEMPFELTYFPPGTVEEHMGMLRRCPDGGVLVAVRAFEIGQTVFVVRHMGGELSFQNDMYRVGYIESMPIHGREGVLARPWSETGYGPSAAFWPTSNGFMMVSAHNLALDELMKIVESVNCADC